MKTRTQKKDLRLILRLKKAKDHVRHWIFLNTAFERLEPEE